MLLSVSTLVTKGLIVYDGKHGFMLLLYGNLAINLAKVLAHNYVLLWLSSQNGTNGKF